MEREGVVRWKRSSGTRYDALIRGDHPSWLAPWPLSVMVPAVLIIVVLLSRAWAVLVVRSAEPESWRPHVEAAHTPTL